MDEALLLWATKRWWKHRTSSSSVDLTGLCSFKASRLQYQIFGWKSHIDLLVSVQVGRVCPLLEHSQAHKVRWPYKAGVSKLHQGQRHWNLTPPNIWKHYFLKATVTTFPCNAGQTIYDSGFLIAILTSMSTSLKGLQYKQSEYKYRQGSDHQGNGISHDISNT